MTDLIDTTPATGGGGLDEGFTDGEGIDDVVVDEAPGTVNGLSETFDEGDGGDEGDEDDGGDDDWTAGLSDDVRSAAGKFRSPEDMARAYVESERRMGELRNDVGGLRDEIASLAASRVPGGTYGSEPSNTPPIPTMGQVASFAQDIARQVDEGDIEVGAGIATIMQAVAGVTEQRETALMAQFKDALAEHTAPLEEENYRTNVGREIQSIKRELGQDTFDEHAHAAAELLDRWERDQEGFVRNPRAVRAAFNEAFVQAEAQKRRESSARVLDRSGRGARGRGVSPSKMILAEMDDAAAPRMGGGGL